MSQQQPGAFNLLQQVISKLLSVSWQECHGQTEGNQLQLSSTLDPASGHTRKLSQIPGGLQRFDMEYDFTVEEL